MVLLCYSFSIVLLNRLNSRRLQISISLLIVAIKIIKKTLRERMPYVLVKPEPEIHVTELADNSVNLEIMVWHHRDHWGKVYPELRDVVKSALDENGIEIPFPQRVVEIHNNNS